MGLRDQWYKNAILYCLDVETYADSNGDGVGDFNGLTSRLDYLASLGITCLWLMPFYPTPNGDDGYDVADYGAIDPRLGTMSDFAEFMVEAQERGLRVIIDLVPNHSSDQHPWFQSARQDPDSPYRDYYVWRTDDPGDTSGEVVFPGEQDGIWTWDEQAEAWYLHHFYPFQPDLNFANPAVREEFRRVIGLWLQYGVSGFRIDAAPFLIQLDDLAKQRGTAPAHDFLREMRDFAKVRRGDAILLGEVDVGLSVLADYFGTGNELQALFNFPLNRYVFLALAQENADAIQFGLSELPSIPGTGQWVNFLRHHDELNLARLPREQREQVFAAFGDDPEFQVYGRGLRRRLATMLDGDQKRLHMAYSLLFGLPGAPMLFYGEEIGMSEQLALKGRMAVRSPMQWSAYDTGGFSTAGAQSFVRPIVADGDYGFGHISVGAQRSDGASLLNWLATLIRVRRECFEIGIGQATPLKLENSAVLGMRYDTENSSVIVLTNLSPRRQSVALELTDAEEARVTDLFADTGVKPIASGNPDISLAGYGYRWLRIGGIY